MGGKRPTLLPSHEREDQPPRPSSSLRASKPLPLGPSALSEDAGAEVESPSSTFVTSDVFVDSPSDPVRVPPHSPAQPTAEPSSERPSERNTSTTITAFFENEAETKVPVPHDPALMPVTEDSVDVALRELMVNRPSKKLREDGPLGPFGSRPMIEPENPAFPHEERTRARYPEASNELHSDSDSEAELLELDAVEDAVEEAEDEGTDEVVNVDDLAELIDADEAEDVPEDDEESAAPSGDSGDSTLVGQWKPDGNRRTPNR